MIALAVGGAAVVILVAVVWARMARGRSDSRSMQNYEHTLHVLGDVSKRSDAAARINPVPRSQADHGHVRTDWGEELTPEAEHERAAEPKPEPAQPESERVKIVGVPGRFEDDSDAFERAREQEELETVVPFAPPHVVLRPPRPVIQRPRSRPAWGRLASVAAVLVVVAGLGYAGSRLLAASPRHGTASPPTTLHHAGGGTVPSSTTSTTPTTVSDVLVPVSTSPTDVAFTAPRGSYTVGLNVAGGTCWVGIQQLSGGPYVWEETLYSGQSASYKASGTLVIRIGAPKYLRVKVNGMTARLPAYVQPYDVTFDT
ncbi:MAG: RodZ domain-containing protein [Acidimicrobiales bacterium]